VPDRKRAIKSIAVFASSRDLIDPVYKKAACDLGVFLANQNYQVYFGGLFIGLMDDFARSILDNNGQLIGYLPKNLIPYADRINVPTNYEERIVDSTDESRAYMFKHADAAIALAGGFGTNVEISGFTEQQYLLFYENPEKHINPMILYNVDGYYDGMFQHLGRQVAEGSVNKGHSDVVQAAHTIGDIEKILSRPLRPASDYSSDIQIKINR
jgi:uncharacterized protein (TIGR00730 family)